MKTAVLISLNTGKSKPEEIDEHLDELAFLAETAGIQTLNRYVQRLAHPDVRTFVGKGKLEEIKQFAFSKDVNNLIFDDDLSPSQLRNLEKEFNPADREEKNNNNQISK